LALISWFSRAISKELFKDGWNPFRFMTASPVFNKYSEDVQKIAIALSNPALLKVITLQCDLFSMGKVYVYRNGKPVESDPAIDRINDPNRMQGRSQYLWDFMFWNMLGNAYLYMSSDIVDRNNAPMYWLEPHKMEWPLEIDRMKDKLIESNSEWDRLMKMEIVYRYEDGTTKKIPLSKIIMWFDLTNGIGNWFKGSSRIDALMKILTNSEEVMNAENINLRYSGKFLVAGQSDPNDVTKTPMGEDEKESIEKKIDGPKKVHGIKSMIDIKRFVDDYRALDLDKAYLAQYFRIGNMFNIPRDVLEAYQSSTFENQEKARAGHVTYTLESKGEDFCNKIGRAWGYDMRMQTKTLVISWDHLPFMQVFEKDRMDMKQKQVNTLGQMLRLGIPIAECNSFLDTNFTIDEKQRQANQGQQGGSGKAS